MKCQSCKKVIPPNAKACKHCGSKIVRKSDKMAKKLTMDGRIAMACGGLLILIAIVMFIYGGTFWTALVLGLGALLMFIGKQMG